MSSLQSTRLQVGASLEDARRALGWSITDASTQTKIRAKYLQALEDENWDVLPSTAYAKGFLRTYARALGLDPDPLVDDYRRRVETGAEPEGLLPFRESILEARRRPVGLEPRRRGVGPWLAALGVALIAVVAVFLIAERLGDSSHHHGRSVAAHAQRHSHHHPQLAGPPSGPVALRLHALKGAQVCLVGDGRPVIDSQALPPGAKAGPFEARRFRLDLSSFGGGNVRLKIDGRMHKLVARSRSSYLIHRGGVSKTRYRGPRCP